MSASLEGAPTAEEVASRLRKAGFLSEEPARIDGPVRVFVFVRDGVPVVRVEGEEARKVCFCFLEVRNRGQLELLVTWLKGRCGRAG